MRRARALASALIAALLIAAPVTARATAAVTREEFAATVGRAASDVRATREQAEADATVAQGLASRIESGPLAAAEVTFDGRTMRPDLGVLRGLVADLASSDTTRGRSFALDGIQANLASLRASLGDGAGGTRPSDPAALKALLAGRTPGAVAGTRTDDVIGRWMRDLLARIAGWLGSSGGLAGGGQWLVWAIVAAAAVLALVVIVRGVMAGRRGTVRAGARAGSGAGEPVVAAAADLPEDALGFADRLARDGQRRDALRALYGGAARKLVEAGVLRRTRTRTDAELLREARASSPAAAAPLERLTGGFEEAWYGHADPGDEGFRDARAAYGDVLDAARTEERR